MTPTVLQNLLSPPILFFALGALAVLCKSDLQIPQPVARFLSIYLLIAIGFHGGAEVAHSGFSVQVITVLACAMVVSFVMPLWCYALLRLKLDAANAAAIAACYGSISAVTFITAANYLQSENVPYSGHMVAAMALMESPAIISGVLLARLGARQNGNGAAAGQLEEPFSWGGLLHEAMFNSAVFMLIGSLLIGMVSGDAGWKSVKPLLKDPFQGILCLFLLDMGLVAANRLRDLRSGGWTLPTFAVVAPLVHGLLGLGLAKLLNLGAGDALLLASIFGSASFIAVPAAMRIAVPQANPSLYVPISLAITFPLNIIVSIPLYMGIVRWMWELP